MNSTARQAWIAIRLIIVGAILLGVVYPLAITGIGKLVASDKANGSLVQTNGVVIGSALIGQNFTGDMWFQPRPSAAGASGYDALASGGSNLGPNNTDLLADVKDRRTAIEQQNGVALTVPPDALTASGSGLDPDISPEYARLQIPRVARTNGLSESVVADVVAANTVGRQLGFVGETRVNVLLLNIAIARISKRTSP